MSESQHITLFGDTPAIRYGNKHGEWDEEAPMRVASFVLGIDLETRTTQLNEQVWDIVNPVKEFWRPEENVADLEVADKKANVRLLVGLGDWVARLPGGRLRAFTNNKMIEGAFPLTQERKPPMTFEQQVKFLVAQESLVARPEDVLRRYLACIPELFDASLKDRERK